MNRYDFKAMMHVRACKDKLTRQQYSTLRGQILAGDPEGAMKGLKRLLRRGGDCSQE